MPKEYSKKDIKIFTQDKIISILVDKIGRLEMAIDTLREHLDDSEQYIKKLQSAGKTIKIMGENNA